MRVLLASISFLLLWSCTQRYPWNFTYEQRYEHILAAESKAIAGDPKSFYDLVWFFRTNDTEIAQYVAMAFAKAYTASPDAMYESISRYTWDVRETALELLQHDYTEEEWVLIEQKIKNKKES